MFNNNKKDPLVDSVRKVMQENDVRRSIEKQLNEELGIASKRALPFEKHAAYDRVLEEAIKEALVGGQHKIDVNNNKRIDAQDFKMLKAGVRKEEANKGLGAMGVPGNVKPHSQAVEEEGPVGGAKDSGELEVGGHTKPDSASRKQIKKAVQVEEEAYSAKAARAGKDIGKKGKMFMKIAKKAEKAGAESGEAVAGAILKKIRAKHMKESNLPLAEKTLTKAEKSEREHLVKKMKGGKWAERYGERGENVMYATATKMAKKLAEEKKMTAEEVLAEIRATLGEEAFNALMEAPGFNQSGAASPEAGKGRTWGPVNATLGIGQGGDPGRTITPQSTPQVAQNMANAGAPAAAVDAAKKASVGPFPGRPAPEISPNKPNLQQRQADIAKMAPQTSAKPAAPAATPAEIDPNMAKFKAADIASMKNVDVADLNRIQKSNLSGFGKAFQTARSLQGIKSDAPDPNAASGKAFSYQGKSYGVTRKDEK